MNQRPTSPSSETVACRCAVGPPLASILTGPARHTVCPLIGGPPVSACLPGLMRASPSGEGGTSQERREGGVESEGSTCEG